MASEDIVEPNIVTPANYVTFQTYMYMLLLFVCKHWWLICSVERNHLCNL